jgi:hypothetical protein
MMVRAKKRGKPGKGQMPPNPAELHAFPSPIRGWVLNENLAMTQPGSARILDNWVCTTTGIRMRGGRLRYATLGAAVASLFSYKSGSETAFAATANAIFDISSIADPDTAPSAEVSGLTSGAWSSVQFGTAGGEYLYIVNGADKAHLFDGSAWTPIDGASTPAITGVATTDLSQVWSFANRLFFVKKNSLSAVYLPVDSIGGAAAEFPMAGVFGKGGSLLFGAKWSMDAGDGLDDKCVFVTTEGEVAVYEGTNPGSAADWRLAGRYDMPRPLGKDAIVGAGGDLLIATEAGMIPISAAISTDLGAIESKSVSRQISPHWRSLVSLYSSGWVARKFNRAGYMTVAAPDGDTCLVANLTTGAWSRFTGWDVRCLGEIGGRGYIGSADGRIYRMEEGGSDDGAIYVASLIGQHEQLGASAAIKTMRQMRANFRFGSEFVAQVGASADFDASLPAPPDAAPSVVTGGWDVGLWDEELWDSAPDVATRAIWSSAGVSGTFIAPVIQITAGGGPTPLVELVSIDGTYHIGAIAA